MAEKAGRKARNPNDVREKRALKGSRSNRRQGTKARYQGRSPGLRVKKAR